MSIIRFVQFYYVRKIFEIKNVRILMKRYFRQAVGRIIPWNEVEYMLYTTIFLSSALNYNSLFNKHSKFFV